MSSSLRHSSDLYKSITENIFKFCEALRFQPTWQQAEFFLAVQRAEMGVGPRQIAVKSGQGPGKTTGSVIATLWRVLQWIDSKAVVTAPSMRQCRDVWLVECRRVIEAADPIIKKWVKVTKSKVEICDRPDWGVKLVTASKDTNAQGYHDPNLTIVAEEASGIERELITQFKGTLSNPNSLFVQIGNPNTRDCAFFDCFNKDRDTWDCYTWNAEDTARDYPHIVTPRRNQQLEDEFGRESDVYRVRVLGEFPHVDPNCVMSSDDLEKVCGQDMEHVLRCSQMTRDDGRPPAKQFGLDFARFGGDESTLYRRSGNAIIEYKVFTHSEPASVVDLAFRMQHEAQWTNSEAWFIADAGGMGQGVMSQFYRASRNVVEFHNGGRAIESKQYANRITEAWFQLAKKVKARRAALPKDGQLIQQLSTRQYYTNKQGLLILETKDDYLKRGFEHSPDRGEGVAYAMYDHVQASGQVAVQSRPANTGGMGVRIR